MFKKILKGLVSVLVLLLLVLVVGGFLINDTMTVDTEQRLKTPAPQLYPLLSTYAGIGAWTTEWLKSDPNMSGIVVKKKSGPDEGVGMSITFESSSGEVYETWTVREVTAPSRVVYEVDFAGMMLTKRTLSLTPGSFEGCDAHWNEVATIDNPVFRWMTLMINFDEVIANRNIALRALDAARPVGE